MSGFSYAEESEEESYSKLKKNIKEIITKVVSEEDKSDCSQKRGKNMIRRDRSEDLMSQFLEVREFQKILAESLKGNNRDSWKKLTKNNKSKQPALEKCESNSETSRVSKSPSQRKSLEGNQDKSTEKISRKKLDIGSELSLVDELISKDDLSSLTEGTDSSLSSLSEEDSDQDKTSQMNSKETLDTIDVKNSSSKSKKELDLIKSLCKGLLKTENNQPGGNISLRDKAEEKQLQKTGSNQDMKLHSSNNPVMDVSINMETIQNKTSTNDLDGCPQTPRHDFTDPSDGVCEEKTSHTILERNKENEEVKISDETKDLIKTENTSGITTDYKFTNSCNDENETQRIEREKDVSIQKESKETFIEPEFFQISDKCVQTILTNDLIEEKNVEISSSKDICKVETNFQQAYPVCNRSDDELIRRSVQELEEIKGYANVEDRLSAILTEEELKYFQLERMDDGDKNTYTLSLEARIDQLQEEISNLKCQLEEIKNYNQQEAIELLNISNLLSERRYKNGLEWEDWELKEMVRERLREKREAAALDYQTRLRVVEALCSAEMGKLEEAYKTLGPLNAAASGWEPVSQPPALSSSWMTQDYFLEVITSMNLSSTDDKTSPENGEFLANGDVPPLVDTNAENKQIH